MKHLFMAAALALPLPALADVTLTMPDGASVVLTRAELAALPAHEATGDYRSADGVQFRGALLWDVIAAHTDLDDDVKEALRHGILATAEDGHAVLVSIGEIAPGFGERAVLLAYARSDAEGEAPIQLVSPGDTRGARHVHGIATLEIR
ncbi:MAG: hypothetical protein Q4G36_11575 [Paracoccus sp. (in: a-proteobacteria)]|nr:hypothetical protein [Paracoccus sp. (in: a-proteobacteria)]